MEQNRIPSSLVIALLVLVLSTATMYGPSLHASLETASEGRLRVSDLWSTTISNSSVKTVDIALVATVHDPNGMSVFRARATGPTIRGGEQRTVRIRDLRNITIEGMSGSVRTAVERTGSLPDGTWKLCIEIVGSGGERAVDCKTVTLASALPPILLAPYDNAEVTDRQVAWSWFMQPRTTAGEEVRCNLVVVEILAGQTPEEAIRVNPVLIRRKNLKGAAWQADPSIRCFRSGSRYAWRLQAVVGATGSEICKSEIWTFVYRDAGDVGLPQNPSTQTPYRPADKVGDLDPIQVPDPTAEEQQGETQWTTPPAPISPTGSPDARSGGEVDRSEVDHPEPAESPGSEENGSVLTDESAAGLEEPGDDQTTDSSAVGQDPFDFLDRDVRNDIPDSSATPAEERRSPPRLGSSLSELRVDDQASAGDTVPLRLTALTRLTVESSSRTGRLSETPTTFLRWDLAPTLRVYGMPLTVNLLLSTERQQKGRRQGVDRGALQFQRNVGEFNMTLLQRVQGRLNDLEDTATAGDTAVVLRQILQSLIDATDDIGAFPDSVSLTTPLALREVAADLETLHDLGLVQRTETALLDIPSLGFGAVAPGFGELFMQGVTLNGGMAEYNPGLLYLGGAVGAIARDDAVVFNASGELDAPRLEPGDIPTAQRTVYAGRVGVGRRDGTHLIASALYADDDATSRSLARLVEGVGGRFRLQRDIVAGIAGRLRNESLRLTLDGEVNASMVDEGTEPTTELPGGADATSAADSLSVPSSTVGTRVRDLAWRGRIHWQPTDDSRLVVGGRYIGPGYLSVGAPGLRSDVLRLDASFDQLVLGKTLALQGELSHEVSGATVEGGTVGSIDRMAVGTELRVPNLPAVSLRYSSTTQRRASPSESGTVNEATEHHHGTLTMNHDARFGRTRIGAFLSASYQHASSTDATGSFCSLALTATGRLSFGPGFTTAVTYGLHETTTAIDGTNASVPSVGVTLLSSPTHWARIRGTFLLRQLADQPVTSITLGGTIDVGTLGSLELQFERNAFASDATADNLVRAILMFAL